MEDQVSQFDSCFKVGGIHHQFYGHIFMAYNLNDLESYNTVYLSNLDFFFLNIYKYINNLGKST